MGRQLEFLDIDNGRLCYEVAGHGSPIVFIHAFSFDMRMWDAQFEAFAKTHKVIRYDLRGFGHSTLPDSQYDHGKDLAQLLKHLNITRPLLIGSSLGSNIALSFAACFPDQISALILASPGLPGHVWKVQRPPEAAREFAREHGLDAGKKNWLAGPVFASLSGFPDASNAAQTMINDYTGWHWMHDDMQAPSEPLIDRLENISTPTLILSGEMDVDGYREIAAVLAERLQDVTLHTFTGAGHMHNMEIADGFNRKITEFAASLKP